MELEVATAATSVYKLQNPTELKNSKSPTPNVNLKLLFVSFLLLLVVFDEFVELHLVSGGVLAATKRYNSSIATSGGNAMQQRNINGRESMG